MEALIQIPSPPMVEVCFGPESRTDHDHETEIRSLFPDALVSSRNSRFLIKYPSAEAAEAAPRVLRAAMPDMSGISTLTVADHRIVSCEWSGRAGPVSAYIERLKQAGQNLTSK